ncbi:MAG: hypothetical protein ACRDAJ_06905 [Serratia fonticola]
MSIKLEAGKYYRQRNGEVVGPLTQYAILDKLILAGIKATGRNPTYDRACDEEAGRLEKLTGRSRMRIIDGRLTALKKAGKIAYLKKWQSKHGKLGWVVLPQGAQK